MPRLNSQSVSIHFTGEVTEVTAPWLEGVTVGSSISVRITVNLDTLPQDSEADPDRAFFSYSGLNLPGYVFQIETANQIITLDSINAATGLGIVPGISLAQTGDIDVFDLAARDEGNPYGALLVLRDTVEPFEFLTGDYFPEDVNFAGGINSGTFTYSDFIHTNAIVATMTASAMSFEYETPSSFLLYRIRVSQLPVGTKRALTASLETADDAFADEHCAAAVRHLEHFQDKVRTLVRADAVLAKHLLDGAQEIIDWGCRGDE
jgi:hypothetical protein